MRSCLNYNAQKGVTNCIIAASGRKSNHKKGGAILMEFDGGDVHTFKFLSVCRLNVVSDVAASWYMPVFYEFAWVNMHADRKPC